MVNYNTEMEHLQTSPKITVVGENMIMQDKIDEYLSDRIHVHEIFIPESDAKEIMSQVTHSLQNYIDEKI